MIDLMLAKGVKNLSDKRIKYPVLVQPKIDGMRAVYLIKEHKLISRNGNEIKTVPHILEDLKKLVVETPEMENVTFLDGELYIPGVSFEGFIGVVKRKNVSTAYRKVRYIIFDAVNTADEDITGIKERLSTAWEGLKDVDTSYLYTASTTWCRNREEIEKFYLMAKEYFPEGVILRNPKTPYEGKRTWNLIKWKPIKREIFTVSYTIPGEGKLSGLMGSLSCRLSNGGQFRVGSGFTEAQRENGLWTEEGIQIEVEYQELSKAGVPRFPVFVRRIE